MSSKSTELLNNVFTAMEINIIHNFNWDQQVWLDFLKLLYRYQNTTSKYHCLTQLLQ